MARHQGEQSRTSVLVVDDHPACLDALASLILSAPDLVLVGSARGGEQAIALSAERGPRVVVMDLVMPGVNGVEATRRVLRQSRPPVVIGLAGSHELVRDAVAAGAAAVVLKDVDPDRLLHLVRAAGH